MDSTSPTLRIVDYGSQYCHLIGRLIRNQIGVWCEIMHPSQLHTVNAGNTSGLILSGGPESVTGAFEGTQSYRAEERRVIEDPNIPILGICYGMQLAATVLGGTVAKGTVGEFGPTRLLVQEPDTGYPMFANCNMKMVWMSHQDSVTKLGSGCTQRGSTLCCIAAFSSEKHRVWGIQFHPEVKHTIKGEQLLRNFVVGYCGLEEGSWSDETRLEKCLQLIKDTVGPDDHVVLGLSGGVDSMVTATLLSRALKPEQWRAVYVDHGLMRLGETEEVKETCASLGIPLVVEECSEEFFSHLKGVIEPEHKRKLIGSLFIRAFDSAVKEFKPTVLAQGTIYPDVVESGRADNSGGGSKQHVIKSHHNVGGLPNDMKMRLLEPLRWLFKDEVRTLGRKLGLPEKVLGRHPFPGPGLAIRILGTITSRKVGILQSVDAIFMNAIRRDGMYDKISQAYAALIDAKAVGVVGDTRRYGYVVVLRAVCTEDFMTASVYPFDINWLQQVAVEIVNRTTGVTRVMYDVTPKPPGTIELE